MMVQIHRWFLRSYCRMPGRRSHALIRKGWSIVFWQTVTERSGKVSLLISVQSPCVSGRLTEWETEQHDPSRAVNGPDDLLENRNCSFYNSVVHVDRLFTQSVQSSKLGKYSLWIALGLSLYGLSSKLFGCCNSLKTFTVEKIVIT